MKIFYGEMPQLPVDCLNGILNILTQTNYLTFMFITSQSTVCVRILWTSVLNYDTIIACFPDESKEVLYVTGIITLTKSPLFNYIEFIEIFEIDNIIKYILINLLS